MKSKRSVHNRKHVQSSNITKHVQCSLSLWIVIEYSDKVQTTCIVMQSAYYYHAYIEISLLTCRLWIDGW